MESTETSYDRVGYPGFPFAQSHPDRLSTMGAILGLNPAPIGAARVLELGCGDGGNLIPMAYSLPGSRFLGVDLSGRSIAEGQATVAALGLANIELRHASITDIDASWGRFDYILAHGLYSWVPAFVRDAVWRIYRDNLADEGIAYLSFNAYPGAHLRQLARAIARFHVRGVPDLDTQFRQAGAILRHVAETAAPGPYRDMIAEQAERYATRRREVVFHDDLSDHNAPFHLHEVASEAERHGLRYLTDAAFVRSYLRDHPGGVPEDEVVPREQYQDFVRGTAYREALFCPAAAPVRREVGPAVLDRLHLSAFIYPATEAEPSVILEIDPAGPERVSFRTDKGEAVETDHRLAKAAFGILREAYPRAVATGALFDEAFRRLGDTAAGWSEERRREEVASLKQLIWTLCIAAHLAIHRDPPAVAGVAGERPLASAVARHQLGAGGLLTDLRHGSVMLEGEIAPTFLALLDGTRTRADLAAALRARLAGGDHGEELTPAVVERNLVSLTRLALLVA